MNVTVYVDVLSHWCYATTGAMLAIEQMLAADVRLDIVLAPLQGGAPLKQLNAEHAWYLRRGALAYGCDLKANWCENESTTTWSANAAVAAAIALGAKSIDVVIPVARAAFIDGELLGRESEAAQAVSRCTGIEESRIRTKMASPEITDALRSGNERLVRAGGTERPTWEARNTIGDHAVLQGVWQAQAILPVVSALLEDERAYARMVEPAPTPFT